MNSPRHPADRPLIGAVVPAAGRSSRMGSPKPLLPVGAVTALEHVVGALRTGGVDHIVAVVGHEAHRVVSCLDTLGVPSAFNPRYDLGMFSSVQVGVAALPPVLDAFFILPVDHPLVRPAVIRAMCERWSEEVSRPPGLQGRRLVLHPTCCGRRGHPPLLAASFRPAILQAHSLASLRDVLAATRDGTAELEVEDLTILMDMDTPADHEVLQRFVTILDAETVGGAAACQANDPTARLADNPRSLAEEEALFILAALRTPENVVRHCRAVATVGYAIATALEPHLPHVDPAAVRAACLLHDMVRPFPRHAALAARLLVNLGFPKVAAMVSQHMVLEPDRSRQAGLTDSELVYLADKLVFEDKLVSLDDREARALEKMKSWTEVSPAAVARVGERMQSARRIAQKVEAVLGLSVSQLLAKTGTTLETER